MLCWMACPHLKPPLKLIYPYFQKRVRIVQIVQIIVPFLYWNLQIFTKILANHCLLFISFLIHNDQAGFIPSQEARDNTSIAVHPGDSRPDLPSARPLGYAIHHFLTTLRLSIVQFCIHLSSFWLGGYTLVIVLGALLKDKIKRIK